MSCIADLSSYMVCRSAVFTPKLLKSVIDPQDPHKSLYDVDDGKLR